MHNRYNNHSPIECNLGRLEHQSPKPKVAGLDSYHPCHTYTQYAISLSLDNPYSLPRKHRPDFKNILLILRSAYHQARL